MLFRVFNCPINSIWVLLHGFPFWHVESYCNETGVIAQFFFLILYLCGGEVKGMVISNSHRKQLAKELKVSNDQLSRGRGDGEHMIIFFPFSVE